MYLMRSNRFLCHKNGNPWNFYKQSSLYYSDDKKSPDNDNEDASSTTSSSSTNKNKNKQGSDKSSAKPKQNATKSFSPETQNRLNDLLKKLSSRSTLGIVKNVQTSKPLGYQNVRKMQRLDSNETKPKNVREAARAVSQELGDANVEEDILSPYKTRKSKDSEFLDNIISTMKTPAERQMSSDTQRESPKNAYRTQQRDPKFTRPKPQLSHSRPQTQDRKPFGSENLNVSLSGNAPIGIFNEIDQLQVKNDALKIWSKLEKHELRLRMSMAPRNYFEKMAYWTEEGKVWHFPIDNEQGLDLEMQTPFTDHIFLEEYIEPWCPQKGAVHNFMELLCIGLSKNPYLSVQQKREHLDWYRNYFEEKRDILQRIIEEKQSSTAQVDDGETATTTKAKLPSS